MFANFFLVFGLLWALNSTIVSSLEFCDAFRQNGNKISYVLREPKGSFMADNTHVMIYSFIIEGWYWRSTLIETSSKSNIKPVMLFTDNSRSCPLFTPQYFGATYLWFKGTIWDKPCATLFSTKDYTNLTVVCNHYKGSELTDYELKYSLVLTGVHNKTKIIFSEESDMRDKNSDPRLVFVNQTSIGETLYVKRFDLKFNGQQISASEDQIETHSNTLKALRSLKSNLDLIAVVPQWTQYDDDYSNIFIFQDKNTIKWCLSRSEELDRDWCERNPSILVNCPPPSPPPPPPYRPPKIKRTNYILIGLIVTLVVLFIILIVVSVYLLIRYLRKKSFKVIEVKPIKSDEKTQRSTLTEDEDSAQHKKTQSEESTTRSDSEIIYE